MSGFNEEQFFEDYIATKPEKTQHELVARYKKEIGPIGAARFEKYLDESHYYGRGPRVSDEAEPEPDAWRNGIPWDIDRNLPLYARDLVELIGRWTPKGAEFTLKEYIEISAATDYGFAPDEHPAVHWERIAGFRVDGSLWAKGSVDVVLEPAGLESAPDGESRPPTPESDEYPGENTPQKWSRGYLRKFIREEINRAVRELGVSRTSRELKIERD